MTGVSYMIPFVAAGGLLIALGFLLGGYEIVGPGGDIAVNNTLLQPARPAGARPGPRAVRHRAVAYLGALLFVLGERAFGFLVPALAGYIAYAIADRPGIAPGFVMGAWPHVAVHQLGLPGHRSSAASSAVSWPASSPTGSPAGRSRPGPAA